MELFDYLTFRWKVWAALLVAGILVILAVGPNAGTGGYRARAELLVRPSASQATTYASDPDRYIETEMSLLFTQSSLARAAEGSGMSADELADALTQSHEPGSESVTLTANAASQEAAVRAVNAVADSYISNAVQDSGTEDAQAEALAQQIKSTRTELGKVIGRIQQATDRFTSKNPDVGTPSASTIAPAEAVSQSLLTNQLQQLSSQQTELELDVATSGTRSQVLRSADSATPEQGWGTTTLLAVIVGWLLVLLSVAAAGLALTSRVIGPARWNQATEGSALPPAVRLRARSGTTRDRTVRRTATSLTMLAAPGAPGAPVNVVYEPEKNAKVEDRAAFLLAALEEEGVSLRELGSLADVVARPSDEAESPARTLLIVDLSTARMEDATALTEYPERLQQRVVPVLV